MPDLTSEFYNDVYLKMHPESFSDENIETTKELDDAWIALQQLMSDQTKGKTVVGYNAKKEEILTACHDSFRLRQRNVFSTVFLVAKSHKSHLNTQINIPCSKLHPLGGDFYDQVQDCVVCTGRDILAIGNIKVGYSISFPHCPDLVMPLPIPLDLLKKLSTDNTRSQILLFEEKYQKDHDLHVYQFSKAN